MTKYHNKKTEIDNIKFDSKKEAYHYQKLKALLRAKRITDLVLQPKFTLQVAFTDRDGVKHRAITYVADFAYNEGKEKVVEDVKGMKTEVYKIKKKLFLYGYGDEYVFREI